MTRVELRTKFIELSGRYDLATDYWGADYTDNGADYFIDNGQKWLERKMNVKRSSSSIFDEKAIDAYTMSFQTARSIKEVWVNNGTSRYELEKKTMQEFRDIFPEPISEIDTGGPLYYVPARLRSVDSTDMDNLATYMNFVMASSESYDGIIFGPPLDEAYVIEVVGVFYLPALNSEGDENYWSVEHSDLLINAALRQLEVSYRNTEGVRDWDFVVDSDLTDLDKDIVDQDQSNIEEMDG